MGLLSGVSPGPGRGAPDFGIGVFGNVWLMRSRDVRMFGLRSERPFFL